MKAFLPLLLSAGLLGAPALAQTASVHSTYQPRIESLLSRAASAIPAGEPGDRDRAAVACALAKNGNSTAAATLSAGITGLNQRIAAWSCLGRAQGRFGKDPAAARASFEKAVQAARQISSSVSDQASALRGIATAWAESGDRAAALRLVQEAPDYNRYSTLEQVARIAARAGDFAPAEALLKLAGEDEERSEANALIAIGHANAGNRAPALAALGRVTQPEHRIAAMLALHESLSLSKAEQSDLLNQALALVPQIGSTGDIDYSDTIQDHDLGAIALAQLESGDETAAVNAAMQTLSRIQQGSNAQPALVKISEIFADEQHLAEALAIAELPSLDDNVRLAVYGGILGSLGEAWAKADEAGGDEVNKDIAVVLEKAIAIINGMSGSDQQWAIASLVEAVARTRNYELAQKFAAQIEAPRQRAYAFSGLALASMLQSYPDQANSSLDLMSAAASEAPERAEILAQSVRLILDELLDDEPVGFAEAAAGLN